MSIEAQLLIWWLLFGGTHVIGSSSVVRPHLVAALGLRGFKGVYTIVSLATFIPLVFLYWNNRHAGGVLFVTPLWTRHVTEALMLFAILFFGLGAASPNPATTLSELRGKFASSARGILRVTRHPQNTAFALFGCAHMASNSTVGDWIYWGGFVVFGLVSAVHQDKRLLATGAAEFKSFHAETSTVPFVAILRDRQPARARRSTGDSSSPRSSYGSVSGWRTLIIGGFVDTLL